MPELFTILIKINIALLLFCAGYYLVLRRLTFYTLNRAYLVAAILISTVYPFIDLSLFVQRHQNIVAPVQSVVVYWKAPAENIVKQAAYWNWLEIAFWTGVTVFAARLIFQLISLYKIYRRSTEQQINGQMVRVVEGDISPFSFWQSIYINPDKLSQTDLNNILEHEQIHVKEWHTLDVLLTEISVVFYWFNPGIWMMKRAVRENIEFITDRKILQKGTDSKAYQYSLLNVTFNQSAPTVTSTFNFSTLKKRIKMMNAKKSSKVNLTRYAVLLPTVIVCLFVFSLSKPEIAKANPVINGIAEAVNDLRAVVTPKDTVPVTKTITGTVTIKKNKNGETTKVITLSGADVNNFRVKIDSPAIEWHTFTTIGKNPVYRDSVQTYYLRIDKYSDTASLRTFKSNNLTYLNNAITYNADGKTLKTISGDSLVMFNARLQNRIRSTTTLRGDSLVIYNYGLSKTIEGKAKDVVTNNNGNNSQDNLTHRTVTGRPAKVSNITGTSTDKLQEVVVEGRPRDKYIGLALYPTQPLFVVDGKEVDQKDLKSVDGSIEFIEAEKATVKYGTKGKNGAVIITTKKGKK